MSESSIPTPLDALHSEWGGKMTGFAGYRLPLSYAGGGFIAEHLHTRAKASLFDVSHMGQARIVGDFAAAAISQLTPADIGAIPENTAKYAVLTNENGGALDDFIIANDGNRGLFVVVNASRKVEDFAHLRANLPDSVQMQELSGWGLIALQGPCAEAAAAAIVPEVANLSFMRAMWFRFAGQECRAARCGYTGEDGFEFSLPPDVAESFARKLAAHPDVKPAGLGARDSLRLEAGLCLYGNELNEEITPVQAGLTWAIPKHRRTCTSGEYPGAESIAAEIRDKPSMRLVGLVAEGKKVARAGAKLFADNSATREIGEISSGVFSPTLQKPIALGFVAAEFAAPDSEVFAQVRGDLISYRTAKPPFVPHQYKK